MRNGLFSPSPARLFFPLASWRRVPRRDKRGPGRSKNQKRAPKNSPYVCLPVHYWRSQPAEVRNAHAASVQPARCPARGGCLSSRREALPPAPVRLLRSPGPVSTSCFSPSGLSCLDLVVPAIDLTNTPRSQAHPRSFWYMSSRCPSRYPGIPRSSLDLQVLPNSNQVGVGAVCFCTSQVQMQVPQVPFPT